MSRVPFFLTSEAVVPHLANPVSSLPKDIKRKVLQEMRRSASGRHIEPTIVYQMLGAILTITLHVWVKFKILM